MSNTDLSDGIKHSKTDSTLTVPIQRETVKELMLDDYEKVIFYLLRKLDLTPEEINVIMVQGNERHEFKIKKPFNNSSNVATIEYISKL